MEPTTLRDMLLDAVILLRTLVSWNEKSLLQPLAMQKMIKGFKLSKNLLSMHQASNNVNDNQAVWMRPVVA